MADVRDRSVFIHVDLPGQADNAPDLAQEWVSLVRHDDDDDLFILITSSLFFLPSSSNPFYDFFSGSFTVSDKEK